MTAPWPAVTRRLFHAPQILPYGCMYHAAYAATGSELFLAPEWCQDLSRPRFETRLANLGYFTTSYYTDWDTYEPTSPDWWARTVFLRRHDLHVGRALLLTVASETMPGCTHLVAARFERDDTVEISDSRRSGTEVLSLDAFMDTHYARAHEVEGLWERDLTLYPVVDARQDPNVQQLLAREGGAS